MGALQSQVVPVNLVQGIDTKTDPKVVVPGKLLTLENATFDGPENLTKRNGYTPFSTSVMGGGTIAAGVGLAAYKGELALADGTNLYSYAAGQAAFSPSKGTYQPVSLAVKPVVQSSVSQTRADVAYHAGTGLECVLGSSPQSTLMAYSIVDRTTGDLILNCAPISNGSTTGNTICKVVTLGAFFVIVYQDVGTTNLQYVYIDTATPTAISSATVIATGGTNFNTSAPTVDVAVINSQAFVGYPSVLSSTNVAVARLSVSGSTVVLGTTQLHEAGESAAFGVLNVFGDASNRLWVGYWNGSAVKAFISDFPTDPTLTNPLILGPTVVETLVNVSNLTGIVSGSTATFYYTVFATNPYNDLVRVNTLTSAGVAGTASVLIRSLTVNSKAFTYGGDTFLLLIYISTLQPTGFLYNASRGSVVCKVAPEVSGFGFLVGGFALNGILPEVSQVVTGTYLFPFLQISQENIVGGTTPLTDLPTSGIQLAEVTFLPPVDSVEAANDLHLSGGFLWLYDSGTVTEHGFHLFPESPTLVASGSDGALSAGTYSFCSVFAWTDNQGQVHRSSPSVAVQVTVSATNHVAITQPTLRVTAKAANTVFVEFYRTTANGTIFFRLAAPGVVNLPGMDTVSYTDKLADATILSQLELYTTGGEVENIATPAVRDLCSYKTRAVVIPADNPTSWWYSKEVLPGAPLEFSDLLVQNETQTGGGFIACEQMDDKLVLFKKETVYYVVGNGPSPSGANNDFTPAQQVVTETGCNNAASVVLMPDGLMYQSPKGIYLLDRSLKDHYIGAAVQAFNAFTVTSAELIPTARQVRMTLSNGTALVYDYYDRDQSGIGQWSVFTGISAVGSALFQDLFTFVTAAGVVSQETPGVFTDNGAFVQMKLLTSWLSFAGLQGFQRVYRCLILGKYYSPHHLNVQVAYDDVSTFVQVNDIPASSTPPYQYRINFQRQKCEAVQLQIMDTQTSAFGEGLSLTALAFEVGVKGGTNRMAATRSYG